MNKSLPLKIVLCLIICLLVGYIGSMATATTIDNWYMGLKKPTWSPPNSIFAPVWITLYVMMAIATAIVWDRGTHHKWVQKGLLYFGLQLAANGAWSVAFFGYQSPYFALLIISTLLILLLFTIRYYRIASWWAAGLLIPYICWVGFAMALNFEIWRLN